jgi:hypothetical protein
MGYKSPNRKGLELVSKTLTLEGTYKSKWNMESKWAAFFSDLVEKHELY